MQDELFDTRGASAFLNGLISPDTLENWRVQGRGPRFRKLGRRVVYSRKDLTAFAEETSFKSTSEYDREPALAGVAK